MKFNSLSLTHFRNRLGLADAWPQLVILGVLCGLVAGLVILAFRLAISWPLTQLLPNLSDENFESLPTLWHFSLPIIGSALIALLLWKIKPENARVGVPHVLERMAYHQGRLPLPNAIVQFISGALALIFGHSAGREGPAVHLGASCGSLLGQWLKLPNNSTRMLVGCGTAAAISASFNTPIAGVIFAMEVVMMEYTLIGFIPVIVASATAAALMQFALGNEIAFLVPFFELTDLKEVPFIVLMGIIIGGLALVFNKTVLLMIDKVHFNLTLRLLLAGLVTGSVAIYFPQIMGLGYDTVSAIFYGDILFGDAGLGLLLGIVLAKLFVTAIAIGLGMPMGLIGPTLVIGAAAGAFLGMIGSEISQLAVSDIGFYAMLGMAAMMGAVLQAPLAGIMAVMELTHNSSVIFPAMAAVISASVTCRYFFPQGSIFQAILLARGLDWRRAPLDHILERASVARCMQRLFNQQPRKIERSTAVSLTHGDVDWIIVRGEEQCPEALISMSDLRSYLEAEQHDPIDLNEMPGLRYELRPIHRHATLKEAQQRLDDEMVDALYVTETPQAYGNTAPPVSILGILRREDIIRFYTEPHGR